MGMMIPRHIQEYENRFALLDRPLVASELGGIDQIVVIPVLAEKQSLPATLASLALNPDRELRRSLILCVINNRGLNLASPGEIKDNQDTIHYLQALINGLPGNVTPSLRLAYIDASSPGREMPDKYGGVGTARKIGLDKALSLFDYTRPGEKLLISLDADTLVEADYLAAIRSYFRPEKAAAVVNYAHQIPVTARERLAISNYEIFLRYYVLGLRYAGSPYAFPSIGSTMVCTAAAYVAVGGMNRRDAAEDFYFLNKLAKFKTVGCIGTTTVYPSARASRRVPFGTGRRIIRFLEEGEEGWLLYDPRIFLILKRWLQAMEAAPDRETAEIMSQAGQIDARLLAFLEQHQFAAVWSKIRKNVRRSEGLQRHFHCWFDGFKTLKLVHFLTEQGLPQINMFSALEKLLRLMGDRISRSDYQSPCSGFDIFKGKLLPSTPADKGIT
jgi:hypothetical protein